MTKSAVVRPANGVVVGMAVWMFLLCAGAGSGRGADRGRLVPPGRELPESIFGVVEVTSMDVLDEGMHDFVDVFAPGAGAGWSLSDQLGKWLFRRANISSDGPMRILLVADQKGIPGPVSVARVADGAAYLDHLRETLKWQREQNGVEVFTYEKTEFDAEAFEAAPPEERQNMQDFRKAVDVTFAASMVKGFACTGRNADQVRRVADLIRAGELTRQPLLPSTGSAAAMIRVKRLVTELEWQIDAAREKILKHMGNASGMEDPEKSQKALSMQLEAAKALYSQFDSVRVGLDVAAEEIRYAVAVDAVPGSALHKYIESVPTGLPANTHLLPADAFAFAAFRIGDLAGLAEPVGEYTERIMEAMAKPDENLMDHRAAIDKMMRNLGDEWVMAVQEGLPMRLFQIVRFRSPQAAEQSLASAVDMARDASKWGGHLYSVEADKGTYRDHPVAAWRMRFRPDDGGAGGETEHVRNMQKRAITGMFGENGWVQQTLVRGRDWLIQTGAEEPEDNRWAALDPIIDGDYEKLVADARAKELIQGMPEGSNGMFFLRLTGLAHWQLDLVRKQAPGMAAMMPEVEFEPGPGIDGYLQFAGRTARATCRIPSAEVKVVVDGVQKAFRGMARQRAQARNQNQDVPPANKTRAVREPSIKTVVTVRDKNAYQLDGKALTWAELDAELTKLGEKEDPVKLIIAVTRDELFDEAEKVMEQAKTAGIKWISVTVKDEGTSE